MTEETLRSLDNGRAALAKAESDCETIDFLCKTIENLCDHTYPDGTDARTYDADGAYCHICNHLI